MSKKKSKMQWSPKEEKDYQKLVSDIVSLIKAIRLKIQRIVRKESLNEKTKK